MPLLIFIYSMFGLLICKCVSFWQEASAVSDSRMTVKACWPYVNDKLQERIDVQYSGCILEDTKNTQPLPPPHTRKWNYMY